MIDEGLSGVEAIADAEEDAVDALWAAARAFLGLGGEGRGQTVTLWIEAHAATTRSPNFQRAREDLVDRGIDIFVRLARRAGWEEPEQRASVIYSALSGAVMRESVKPLDCEAFLRDLAAALGLEAPRRTR